MNKQSISEVLSHQPEWALDFIPHDLQCYSCGKSLVDTEEMVEKYKEETITGCPFCNRSFVS
ncbi:MAG: hypothetical protein ACTSR1_00150 [Candidatus Heimdallarchaeota archaeon]